MEKFLIYVTVGTSQFKFNRMLDQVKACLDKLDKNFEVVLQFGSSDKVDLPGLKKSNAFISREESEYLYQHADLIFSHAGIGSIFNSLKYNRPTVLFTRLEKFSEFTDDHQLQIAKEMKKNKLVYVSDIESDSCLKFIESNLKTEKKEVDLINYSLASFINKRLCY